MFGTVMKLGDFNKLKILRNSEFGLFLQGELDQEILLPKRFVTPEMQTGEEIEAFIYRDSEDRLVATTEKPLAKVGDFALLEVNAVSKLGAFLNWGLAKDLFLPFAEQTRDLNIGQKVAVVVYEDKTQRLAASMRLDRYAQKDPGEYKENQKVDLFIVGKSDLGFKAVINNRHIGVIYENEVFQNLHYGQKTPGFIKKVRDDGKIDLILQPMGSFGAQDLGEQILAELKEQGGFLNVTDKTDPEIIYGLFGVSKKKYKMAIGGLYKKRLIEVTDEGIRLTAKSKA